MGTYLLRRLLLAVPMILVTTSVTFLIMSFAAGDYVPGLDLEVTVGPEYIERLRSSLGLDRPLHERYLDWIGGVLRGDLGRAMLDNVPVTDLILERLPNTVLLSFAGLLLAFIIAIPLGVISAVRRGSRLDSTLNVIAVTGFALPHFWFGLMLIAIFSISARSAGLPWLPSGGASDPGLEGNLPDRLRHLILPAVTLSLRYIAVWSRFVRSSMIEVLTNDYVRTARAKGLAERRIMYVHALRNGLAPLITLIGLELPHFFSGSLVIEVVFGWPGVGQLAYDRALGFDFTMVLGITIFISIMVIIGNLLADVGYGLADPRVRVGA